MNTITLLPIHAYEERLSLETIRERLGDADLDPFNTILSPVGIQNDPAGLIRGALLGLGMLHIARQNEGLDGSIDRGFAKRTIQLYKDLCESLGFEGLDLEDLNKLKPQDIINLATSDNINIIILTLNKLIRILPIVPLDVEEFHQINKATEAVFAAA